MSKSITINQHNGHEFVEIAGIKWATCNVGAEKPTDMGLYFQWGDRKGYTADEVGKIKRFDMNHYKHHNGKRISKYTEFDNKHVLGLSDDAAFAYMGHGWRMPTQDDFRCLLENTTHRWTDNYQNSGVRGMVLTDVTDDTKELFFPSAGHCYKDRIHYVYKCGCYWSRLLDEVVGDAFYMYFDDETVECNSAAVRHYGFPVRGVAS